jgi:hypothetical protein
MKGIQFPQKPTWDAKSVTEPGIVIEGARPSFISTFWYFMLNLEVTDSTNMFCCFRWLLIMFKREFYFDDLKTLWEVTWACPFTAHFHLFIALAILNNYRRELFQTQAFDEVLKVYTSLLSLLTISPRS